MISPTNRKLKMFHLLVSTTVYIDFCMTGFILGNYRFQIGEDPNFLDHDKVYTLIMIVQITDIVLNFFKMQVIELRLEKNPWTVAYDYIRGQLVSDIIACLPWSVIKPSFIFLRYLKLMKFGVY